MKLTLLLIAIQLIMDLIRTNEAIYSKLIHERFLQGMNLSNSSFPTAPPLITATPTTPRPVCQAPQAYAFVPNVLIRSKFESLYYRHLALFRYNICLMEQAIWDSLIPKHKHKHSRFLSSTLDPTAVVISVNLIFDPIFFYQNIIYKRGNFYFFQTINTGMTLAVNRLLQETPEIITPITGFTLSTNYAVQSFPNRVMLWSRVLEVLRTKPMLYGMVTSDFDSLKRYIPGLNGNYEENVIRINADNVKDWFGVCETGEICPASRN
jgi:hypothetical protein